jgi:transcriptional regulator with XRE-family HTH domain
MAATLQHWRKRNNLTQVDAASLLGLSQPYMSLLEHGARPLTAALRKRMKAAHRSDSPEAVEDSFRAQLSALGYPGFAHVAPARPKPNPGKVLLSVLASADTDSRIVEGLPWLVRQYNRKMDLNWLVRQAKLQDLQNHLGFLLQMAGVETQEVLSAVRELDRARLLQEATLCWDSMPAPTREWMRANRTTLAKHWNVLTRLQPADVPQDFNDAA